MSNSGFLNSDEVQNAKAKAILLDTGLIPNPDGNYEMKYDSPRLNTFKTFSKDIHSGIYVQFDPLFTQIDIK